MWSRNYVSLFILYMQTSILLAVIIGVAYAVPTPVIQAPVLRNDELIAAYVLPTTITPTFYDVSLFIDPGFTDSFNGNVSIRIIASDATNEIVLHALEMEIDSITVSTEQGDAVEVTGFTLATDDTELLKIQLGENIDAFRPYVLTIEYVAHYATDMFGVYVSTYTEGNQNINLVTSQLQPTYARRAFPCFDEPHFKAVFRTTIYAPPAYEVVRSNMPLRTDTMKPEVTGYTKHEFQDTLVMSSYLLAYLVSNLDYVENTVDPIYRIPFRVYSRPEQLSSTEFALDFGQKNMVALEEYTQFPYDFPKLDNVAVPDFAAGAMENWGLIIYREVALLVQEGVTTTAVLQNIGRIITHENMHQWFGNEVSPLSWTYTWLNEGFANFFESFGTDMVLPEWRMMEQFIVTKQATFQSDAVLTVNPMTYEVYTPSQVIGTFNAIAYQKSGAVIQMMQHFLTPDVFRQGLIIYLRDNSRKAVDPTALYAAMQQALDESDHTIDYDVATIMERWTLQGGFPILNVRRTSPTADSFYVDQERYLTDRTLTSDHRWHVPINWVLSSSPDFSDTQPQAWLDPADTISTFSVAGLAQADWFIVNKMQTGYYRVNYDEENWDALINQLKNSHSTIQVLNRAQLVDDSFNLARNGRLAYTYPFELSTYLVEEADYIPWASANAALTYLNNVLSGTEAHDLFRAYVLALTAPLYSSLGFIASANEEHVTAYHRNIILNYNCRFGNQDCVDTAAELLLNFRNNPDSTLNPDIQTNVFCYGLMSGDTDNFNFLWEKYSTSQDASEQSILLNAMGCTTNEQTRTFYMNQVISDDSLVREQDRHTILVSTINAGGDNTEAAFDFVIENFLDIQPRVNGLSGMTNILNALANMLTTEEHLAKTDGFYQRYENDFTAGELASIDRIRENIAASVTWNSENLESVGTWLQDNYGGDSGSGATVIASSFALLSSIVLSLYFIN